MTDQNHSENSYTAQENSINYKQKKSKKGISFITVLIILISIAFVAFVVYQNLDNVKEKFNIVENTNDLGLHIGDPVLVEGNLTPDGDFVKYTHRLDTEKYGILGVKSTTINLNNYSGKVRVKAVVDGIYKNAFIINVSSIENIKSDILTGGNTTGDNLSGENQNNTDQGEYFQDAGLYFSKIFLQTYKITNSGENNTLTLKNTTTQNDVSIEYFLCTTSDANKNCAQLSKDYSKVAGNSIKTSYGITFYRLGDSNKRFFNNSNRRGYRIKGVDEQELASLAQNLKFINESYFTKYVLPNIHELCSDSTDKINEIENYSLDMQNQKITATIYGKTFDSNAECKLNINPELTLHANKISFKLVDELTGNVISTGDTKEDTKNEDDKNITEESKDIERDENIAQFPINLDKSLTFESRRGYKVIFPAGNISWRAGSIDDKTLGQAGVNCRATLDVDKYEKNCGDTIENPKIKIYECSIKNDFETGKKYRHLVVQDDRHFIIEILDPSWIKFADNIIIE